MKRILTAIVASTLLVIAGPGTTCAQESKANTTLIQNVKIFEGKNEKLAKDMSVLIEGNKIAKIAKSLKVPNGATVIDAKGKTLMPGLIDDHWHSLFAILPQAKLLQSDMAYINSYAAKANEDELLRGFTSVRDVGGNVFGLKKATDEVLLTLDSGLYICQRGGGGIDVPQFCLSNMNQFKNTMHVGCCVTGNLV